MMAILLGRCYTTSFGYFDEYQQVAGSRGPAPRRLDGERGPLVSKAMVGRGTRIVNRKKDSKKTRFAWLRTAAWYVWILPDFTLRFVVQWWTTRPWTSLLWGLPAILSGLALLAVEPWHNRTLPGQWARRYDREGLAALSRGDLQAADVYFRRVAFLDDASPASSYGLALTAEQQGDLPRARRWMLRIAPEAEAGYPPAHFWLAKDLTRGDAARRPQDVQLLEHHLLQAARSADHQLEARVNLAQLYTLQRQPDKAIAQLEQAVARQPALQLDLAQLYALAQRPADARRAAAKAGEFFASRAAAEPAQPQFRQAWASSLVLQERHEDAIRILTEGLKQPDPEPFQRALSAVYLHWLGSASAPGKPNVPRQLELLDRALQHDANNEQALRMLGRLAIDNDESAAQATDMLKQMLARGAAPAVIHLALGTQALHRGDVDTGLMHLEQAQERNPRIPTVLNNLAWGLTQQDEPDLERARQLAEAAQQLSKHPETYDTLGTILARQGKLREAVTQFETALRLLPPRAKIHRQLGDLYQQLGDAELAGEHRRLAEQLEAEADPAPPTPAAPK